MPVYQIRGKNGKLYQIEGPPGATREQIIAAVLDRAPEAGVPPQEKTIFEDYAEEVPILGGLVTGAADIGLGAVQGLTGAIGAGAEAFGADNPVAEFFEGASDYAGSLMSAGEREDILAGRLAMQRAEGKGLLEEGKAALSAFGRSPLTLTAQALGSAAPIIAASLATEGAAAPVMISGVMGSGAVKGSIYDSVEQTAVEKGLPPEVAKAMADEAQSYLGENTDQIALGTTLGVIAGRFGIESGVAKLLGKEIAETAVTRGVVSSAARGALAEAVPEAVQAGQERVAGNIALQREGYDVPTTKGAFGQAALEGLMGGAPGAFTGAANRGRGASAEDPVTQAEIEAEIELAQTPPEAQSAVAEALTERFIRRGFNDEISQNIVRNAQAQAAAAQRVKEEEELQRQEEVAARTASAEPSAEPDISAPPPVDPEELAARERFYAEEVGAAPLPTPMPVAPEVEEGTQAGLQPTAITPQRAASILNNPTAFSDFMARFGMDESEAVETLSAIEGGEPSTLRYSRGRRPRDTETVDMFGALPVQEAPGIEAKRAELSEAVRARRAEIAAEQSLTDEERAARQARAAAEAEARRERVVAMRQREEAEREETLGDIEYALRAQAPENAVYKVEYNPGDANPYRLVAETQLGKKPEEVLKAPTLQDFSDQVYGRMMELTPYIPPAPAAVQDVEPMGPTEQEAPTEATRLVQEFTAEVDAAREAGLIDNNQRAQLLRRLERPDAYRPSPDGKRQIPADAIAKLEAAYLEAASTARNASAEERPAAEAAMEEASKRLGAAVRNSLLNPARAALRSLVEMRQDEKVGAKTRLESARVQERLGQMEGKRTKAETQEARDAKIDLQQLKVQKYSRAKNKSVSGVTSDKAQRVVDAVTSQWKSTNKVKVVQSVQDIPNPRWRAAITRDKATNAEGFVAPDGTIYLIADNLTDEARVKAVLFHEALGHLGLEQLFRGDLDQVLTTLYRGNAKLKADTDAWMKANPDAYPADADPLARAVEEVLAERSEAGQIETNLFQRLAALVRDFARRMGIRLKVTDADVNAILSMAHTKIISGPQVSTAVKGLRYVSASDSQPSEGGIKLPLKERQNLEQAAAGLSAGRRRVNDTLSTYGIMDGIEEATGETPKVRDVILEADDVAPAVRAAALKSMPTSGIMNWLERKNKTVHSVAEQLVDTVRKMNGMRASLLQSADPFKRRLDDFVREYGSVALARLRFTARINETDPFAFKTMAEALTGDKRIKAVEDTLLKNSNNKAETRKLLDQLKEQAAKETDTTKVVKDKVRFSVPVRVLYNNLTKLAIDRSAVELKVQQLAALSQRVRDTYLAKEALAKQKGGLELYKEERDYHKDMFDARLALLDERIERSLGKGEAIRMRDMRSKLMREVQSPEMREKAKDLFWDLDPELFHKDYFPMMREGQYWLRVSEDLTEGREEAFYTFDSAWEMNRAKKRLARQLGVDPELSEGVITTGNDIGELQNTLRETDELMQRVFDIVGKARESYKTSGNVDMKDLVDQVYQTWLMTTPERSARRRFMHAKELAGFSVNVMSDFGQQVATNANELTKLAYAGTVRAKASAVKDVIKDASRPDKERAMLGDFARELESRAELELNPPPRGAISSVVNFINRASYYFYLTSAKTALLNFVNIPVRVIPRFWRDYGYAEGTAMWLKYMNLWNSLGKVKIEHTKARFGDYVDAVMPNVNGSEFVKNNADLQWALKAGMERGILMTTADTIVHNDNINPSKDVLGLSSSAKDVAANAGKVMSFLFTGTENISRQATFYMSFELALNKYRKENKRGAGESKDAYDTRAREHALKQSMRIVDDTIGNFSDWERPRIAKGELTRAFFLFKMHPILQTKFLVGAFRDIFLDPKERAGALKELTGVLMMAGVLGGVTAMPLYSMFAYALSKSVDEEDDEEVKKLLGIDVRTAYDPDMVFRRWVMEHLGMSDEAGDTDIVNALLDGPAAVLTDTEMSSSVTLDLAKMWYREPIAGDSLEGTVTAAAIANIAGLSLVAQVLRGFDAFQDGNVRDGLKNVLPAFVRAPVVAGFNEAEGVKNRKGDTIIEKDEITSADTFRSAVGARSLRLAKWQDYYITAMKKEKRIEEERDAIFDEIERMVDEGEFKTQADFNRYWNEVILPFNRTYPDPDFVITLDRIEGSLKRRGERDARTIRGMEVSKKSAERRIKSAAPFMP